MQRSLLLRVVFIKLSILIIFQNKSYYRGFMSNCQWLIPEFHFIYFHAEAPVKWPEKLKFLLMSYLSHSVAHIMSWCAVL